MKSPTLKCASTSKARWREPPPRHEHDGRHRNRHGARCRCSSDSGGDGAQCSRDKLSPEERDKEKTQGSGRRRRKSGRQQLRGTGKKQGRRPTREKAEARKKLAKSRLHQGQVTTTCTCARSKQASPTIAYLEIKERCAARRGIIVSGTLPGDQPVCSKDGAKVTLEKAGQVTIPALCPLIRSLLMSTSDPG